MAEQTPEARPSESGAGETPPPADGPERDTRVPLGAPEALAVIVFATAMLQGRLAPLFDNDRLQTWSTVFVSITVQALPFLTLGVTLSGLIAAFLPGDVVARLLPRHRALAVPVAGVAGVALPGCECGSVPIAGRLVAQGANPAPALTFLLAAPAINPIVIASTVVAFPGQPEVAAARFIASLATALIVGWIWLRVGTDDFVDRLRSEHEPSTRRWDTFRKVAMADFLHAGGYLVLGAFMAATIQVLVPRSTIDAIGGSGVAAVATMAILAVVLSICSEADAFVAVGLSQFSLTSRLVFLVVGPAVDLKLIALQAGIFGKKMVWRFAPLTFCVAVASALITGGLLL